MTDRLKLGVYGASGRMGQRVLACAVIDPAFEIVGAYVSPESPHRGEDAGVKAGLKPLGIPLNSELEPRPDVIIDFSTPEATMQLVVHCEQRQIPLVIATTGLTAADKQTIAAAAQVTPILMAPSMSLSVNIAMKLVREAGLALRDHSSGVDVEIIERHHRFKEDAPSGTALKFGEIVAGAMGQDQHRHGRQGRIGQRPRNEIGYHALRLGDNVGEHTIAFGLLGETLEVTVRGQSRDSYAFGALTAARFLVTQSAGLYSMSDALDL